MKVERNGLPALLLFLLVFSLTACAEIFSVAMISVLAFAAEGPFETPVSERLLKEQQLSAELAGLERSLIMLRKIMPGYLLPVSQVLADISRAMEGTGTWLKVLKFEEENRLTMEGISLELSGAGRPDYSDSTPVGLVLFLSSVRKLPYVREARLGNVTSITLWGSSVWNFSLALMVDRKPGTDESAEISKIYDESGATKASTIKEKIGRLKSYKASLCIERYRFSSFEEDFLSDLSRLARMDNLRLLEVRFDPELSFEAYHERPVELRFVGSFADIVQALEIFEKTGMLGSDFAVQLEPFTDPESISSFLEVDCRIAGKVRRFSDAPANVSPPVIKIQTRIELMDIFKPLLVPPRPPSEGKQRQ